MTRPYVVAPPPIRSPSLALLCLALLGLPLSACPAQGDAPKKGNSMIGSYNKHGRIKQIECFQPVQ